MPELLTRKIINRMIFITLLSYSSLAFILTLIQINLDYTQNKRIIEQTLVNYESFFKELISEALWNFDLVQLDNLAKGMLYNPLIYAVKINSLGLGPNNLWLYLPSNKAQHQLSYTKYTHNNLQGTGKAKLLERNFSLNTPSSVQQNLELGDITIYSSKSIIYHILYMQMKPAVILFALKLLALLIILVFFGKRFITTPLRALTYSTQNVVANNLTNVLLVPAVNNIVEFSQIQQSFNNLVNNVYTAKQTESSLKEQLLQAKQYLQNIIYKMPVALIVFTNDSIYQYNWAALKFFNMQPANKALTIDSIKLILGEHWSLMEEAITTASTQIKHKATLTIEQKVIYANIAIYPLFLEKTHYILSTDDITDICETENRMLQQRKMAIIGRLASSMAHDLNSPLQQILTSVCAIQDGLDIENTENIHIAQQYKLSLTSLNKYLHLRKIDLFLTGIKELAERALEIINNIEQFNSAQGNFEVVDLVALVQNIGEDITKGYIFPQALVSKNISFSSHILVDNLKCQANPLAIRQVITNLLKNAYQALSEFPPHSATISLTLNASAKFALIEIADNGIGISKHLQAKIFEPFFTTKAVGVGTGIGLSLCYYLIVNQHHGMLEIDSKEGCGARFTLKLPIIEAK